MIVRNKRAFTLIETILACVILCGSGLVLSAVSTRSLGLTKLNRQYETAAGLAGRQLRMIDYVGIEDFMEAGKLEGDLERPEAVYRWEVSGELEDIGSLYRVKVDVSWFEGRRKHFVRLESRINGVGENKVQGQLK